MSALLCNKIPKQQLKLILYFTENGILDGKENLKIHIEKVSNITKYCVLHIKHTFQGCLPCGSLITLHPTKISLLALTTAECTQYA